MSFHSKCSWLNYLSSQQTYLFIYLLSSADRFVFVLSFFFSRLNRKFAWHFSFLFYLFLFLLFNSIVMFYTVVISVFWYNIYTSNEEWACNRLGENKKLVYVLCNLSITDIFSAKYVQDLIQFGLELLFYQNV